MKVKLILLILMVFSLAASTPISLLTSEEINSSIEIDNINDRPIPVEPGRSVVYHVRGTDIYLKVSNQASPTGKAFQIDAFGLMSPLAEWDATQVCGVDVYVVGLHVARLRNRVNVHY